MWALRIPLSPQRRKQLKQDAITDGKEVVKIGINKKTGRRTVTGGKDLRGTQSYPRKFGAHLANVHMQWWDSCLQSKVEGNPEPNNIATLIIHTPLESGLQLRRDILCRTPVKF